MDGCMATSVETDTRKCQRHPEHSWLCVYSDIAGASCNRTLSPKHCRNSTLTPRVMWDAMLGASPRTWTSFYHPELVTTEPGE